MPELPEVETVVRTLRPALVGARITAVETSGFALRLGRPVDTASLRDVTVGAQVLAVRRRGKYILIDVTEPGGSVRGGVLVHLGMTGRLRVQAAGEDRLPHTHIVWTLSGGRELRFVDPRRFGWVEATGDVDRLPEIAALGPDPLLDLDVPRLEAALATSRAPVKAFLLDQDRVAGLGNIYVCEALFLARIHPGTPARRARRRAAVLLTAVQEVLEQGIRNRGTTLRDYVDASGASGDNASSLRVYGREGQPCPACGTPIRRRVDAGRSTFYCVRCQRA